MRLSPILTVSFVVLVGCGPTEPPVPDAGATTVDAGGIAVGARGGACYPNQTCDAQLTCQAGVCATAPLTDAGTNDAGTGNDAGIDAGMDAGVVDAGPTPTTNFWTFGAPWETRVRNTAEVARIFTRTQSFVVVYADNNGARGAELFNTRVSQLSPSRIMLDLDPNLNNGRHWEPNQILHLAVYEDLGTRSVYEPGIDPLRVDNMGRFMETSLNLRFISSTTVESSQYYHRNCTTSQFEENRTDLPVDCRCNEALTGGLPICWAPFESYPNGHAWGSGPRPADVNSLSREVGGGFLNLATREFIVAMNWSDATYTQSAGVIWAINVDTGARRIVSGVINTPAGYQVTGSGYLSNVTVNGVLRHTAPMPYLWDVQPGPDGAWYTYGSDTQDNVEIIRVDPLTGDRTLVWHIDVAGQNHLMGQCTTTRVGALSVQYTEKSFAMDPLGNFYLSFHDGDLGDGVVKVPLNGASCTPVMRVNTVMTSQLAFPLIGTGATFQPQNIRGMGWVNGNIIFYTVIGNRLFSMDPLTGNRIIVSSDASPQVGTGTPAIGENWFIWDPVTSLLWTSGGAADKFVAIDLATGNRQNLLQLSSAGPLVFGGHVVDHATRGPLSPGVWSRQRFIWHPDNHDHVMMMINSMGLGVYELHTSNSYMFSL